MVNLVDKLIEKPIKDKGKNIPHNQFVGMNIRHQIDTLFLPSDRGYMYCLVIVDVGTRETDARPMRDKRPETVVKALKDVYSKNKTLEAPDRIETDKGNEFKGAFNDFVKEIEAYHKVSRTGRHRQTGLVEKRNQMIGAYLNRAMLEDELLSGKTSRKWIDRLPQALNAINKKNKAHVERFMKYDKIKFNLKPVCEGKSCELLDIGTKVRVIADEPRDHITGKRLAGKFREGDIRWHVEPKRITDISIVEGLPPLYMVDGFDHTAYTRNQLQIVENAEKMPDPKDHLPIQRIVRRMKKKNKLHFLVAYKGRHINEWKSKKELIEDGYEDMVNEYESKRKK